MQTKNPNKHKKVRLIILASVLVVILLSISGFAYFKKSSSSSVTNGTASDGTKMEEATPVEKSEAEQRKEEISKQQAESPAPTPPPTSGGSGKTVSPVINYWTVKPVTGDTEFSGYVGGVFEDGGTCTITLVKDGVTVSESSTGMANATNTTCGTITVAKAKLTPGKWSATLSYKSATASGTSAAQQIAVQ